MEWTKITGGRYDQMLGMLPPAVWAVLGNGFLVGEAWDHGKCSITGKIEQRYIALVHKDGQFYESKRPMTIAEFKALKFEDINPA